MRITENRLRSIIRQVIVENLEGIKNQILDDDGKPFDRDYVELMMPLVGIDGDPDRIIKSLGSLSEDDLSNFRVDYSYVVNNDPTYFEMRNYTPNYVNVLNNSFMHKSWGEMG